MAGFLRFNNMPLDEFLMAVGKGIGTQMPKGDTIRIAGQPFAKQEVLGRIAELLKPYDVVEVSRRDYEQKEEARNAAEPSAQAFARDLSAAIASQYGSAPAVLTGFGIPTPKPRRELSPEEKVVKAAKAQKTRQLRGTQGRQQRRRMKASGDYEVSVGAPPKPGSSTAAASPTPTPTVNVVVPPANGSTATNPITEPISQLNGSAHA